MRLFYLSGKDLSGETVYTNLAELWLDDPEKRRLMRQAGIEEETVCRSNGDFALLAGYLSALNTDPGAKKRAAYELAVAFGYGEDMLEDAEKLWNASAEALSSTGVTVRSIMERAEIAKVQAVIPIAERPQCTERLRPVMELGVLFSLCEGVSDAICALEAICGEPIEGIDALIRAIGKRIDAFDAERCEAMLLTVEDRLPPCVRATAEDLDAWLRLARAKDGKGLREDQRDAIRARLLFGVLPLLRRSKKELVLRAGEITRGDGRFSCGFDALSFAEIASRLKDQMPRTLLCPQSKEAEGSMKQLLGVFPSISGVPAVEMQKQIAFVQGRSPLSLISAAHVQIGKKSFLKI